MDKHKQIIEGNEKFPELREEEEKNQGLDEIPDIERQVFFDREQMSIFELKRRKDRGDLQLQLSYQRKNIWPTVKKSKLIESALLLIPVPEIYLAEKQDGTREVIDGQQRLLAFFEFLDNRYELSNLYVLRYLNGKKFKNLKSQEQRKIEDYPLHIFTIKKESHPDIKFDVFLRINQGLNAQEIRQYIYRGDGINLIKKMASNPAFKEIIERTNLQVSRLKDEELVLRFLSFYLNGYQLYTGDMISFLNETLVNFDLYRNILDNIEIVFDKIIKDIKLVFGDKPFTISKEGRANKKLNSSLFDILTVSFARYDSSLILQNKETILEEFNKLMCDSAFYNSITSGTLTKTNVKLRFEKWFDLMDKIMGGKSDAQ